MSELYTLNESLQTLNIADVNIVKPPLKWVGGKTQIIKDILNLFPSIINNYYEPFLGGGSVLFALLSYIQANKITLNGKIYASDINQNLIYFYINLQNNPQLLIKEITKITNQFNQISGNVVNRKPKTLQEANTSQESYYYWIRSKFNLLTDTNKANPEASAMLLFLNKTCFRGIYRESSNGFNVPFGNYKNPSIFDESHILHLSQLIKDVQFSVNSFQYVIDNIVENDFVYFDPPYIPENTKSFVSYNVNGFDIDNHKLLLNICQKINNKKIKFLMSNSYVKLITDTFTSPNYNVKIIECKRTINSKKPQSKTNEVIISNNLLTLSTTE